MKDVGFVDGSYVALLIGGFFLGIGGTSFAVGVPTVNSWFPPHRRGTAIGIFGAGMGGTAIAAFTTLRLRDDFGDQAPFIPAEGAIPLAPEPLPDAMDYDPAAQRLRVGKGFVANVTPAMWAYTVSGKPVLRQWFSYRRRDRTRPIIGDRRPPSRCAG